MYTTTQFAKLIGVDPMTLRRWDKNGTLKPIHIGTNHHRRYNDEHLRQVRNMNINASPEERWTVIYARESTPIQRPSLDNQIQKCKDFCLAKGYKVHKVISEFGSALDYNRNGLNELVSFVSLEKVDRIIIYYKDRLLRFGFEMIHELCKLHKVEIIVIDDSETDKTKKQEFAEDLISILHHFSMKLYGSRSYKKKVKAAKENIEEIIKEQLN